MKEPEGDTAGYYIHLTTVIYTREREIWHSIQDLVDRLLDIERLRKKLIEHTGDDNEGGTELTVPMPDGSYFINECGNRQYISHIAITLLIDQDPFRIDFRVGEGSYKSAQIMWGEYSNEHVQAIITQMTSGNGEAKFSAIVATHDGKHTEIFNQDGSSAMVASDSAS